MTRLTGLLIYIITKITFWLIIIQNRYSFPQRNYFIKLRKLKINVELM